MSDFEVKCSDIDVDVHEVITKKVNPIMATLHYQYCESVEQPRRVTIYYNEEDGARVEVLHTDMDMSINTALVCSLFNLRDFLFTHKINFDKFREEVGRLTGIAFASAPELYPHFQEILSSLGCRLELKPTILRQRGKHVSEKYQAYAKLMSTVDYKNIATLRIILRDQDKPLPNKVVHVRIETVVNSEPLTLDLDVKTNKNGEVVLPVAKYSKVKITSPYSINSIDAYSLPRMTEISVKQPSAKEVELIVEKNNIKAIIYVEKRDYLKYLILGSLGAAALLIILSLL